MGEAKRNRKDFFKLHPFCCFCGGSEPATEFDEQPPRAMFIERQWPTDYRFPACSSCNRSSRTTDLAVSYIARFGNPNDEAHREQDTVRLFTGIKNNVPELIPDIDLSSNEKRRTLRKAGLKIGKGEFYRDAPIVGIDNKIYEFIDLFLIKLCKALYYKHRGLCADQNLIFLPHSEGNISVLSAPEIGEMIASFPIFVGTKCNGRDISDQFSYRWGNFDNGETFGFLGLFGGSFAGVCVCTPKERISEQSKNYSNWYDFSGLPLTRITE